MTAEGQVTGLEEGRSVSRLPAVETWRQSSIQAGSGPIFVHSSFRTASTWIWQKLRAVPHVTAYYEVFNEGLGHFRKCDVGGLSMSTWASKHPAAAPYFLEYLALLQEGGGLPAFDASLPYDRFIPAGGTAGTLSLEERVHLDSLIQAARHNGKIPVLTCTRTLGRASAIGKACGGTSILIVRNLFHQWASYSGQAARGNPYFLETINKTIHASLHDSFIRDINEYFYRRTKSEKSAELFLTFLILHLYLYAHSYEASDLIIDSTKICVDEDYKNEIEARLSDIVDYPIDLSDAAESFDSFFAETGDRRVFADTLDHFVDIIMCGAPSVPAALYVAKLRDEMLAELDLHEFYAAKSRGFLLSTIDREQKERAEAEGRVETISQRLGELESFQVVAAQEPARLRQEVADLSQSITDLGARAEASDQQYAEATAGLKQALETASVERNQLEAWLEAERSAAATERFDLELSHSAERNRMEEQLEVQRLAAAAERAHLELSFSAERDRMEDQHEAQKSAAAAERSEFQITLASSLAERLALAGERDGLLTAVADLTLERDKFSKLYSRGMINTARARLASVLKPK